MGLSLIKSLYKMVQQKQLVFLFLASLATQALSFSVASRSAPFLPSSRAPEIVQRSTALRGLFAPEEGEQKTLPRDSEPDEFFSAKMDEMSDSEKLPIALAGLAGISLPFIFGLIALYAAK